MTKASSFWSGVAIGAAAIGVLLVVAGIIASGHESRPQTFAEELAALSEKEVQSIESKARRFFATGSYPLLAAHVGKARFILSIYDRRGDDPFIQRACAFALIEYRDFARQAATDPELAAIAPEIAAELKELEAFLANRPELYALLEQGPIQQPEPMRAKGPHGSP